MTVAEFIEARLDDDETGARMMMQREADLLQPRAEFFGSRLGELVLRQVTAIRAILALYTDGDGCVAHGPDYGDAMGQVVEAMASVWSDHPDYQPGRPWEWKP